MPTWNYAVVHARGVPTFTHDRDWMLAHVSSLTDAHEAAEGAPWAVADAPTEYVERRGDGASAGLVARLDEP